MTAPLIDHGRCGGCDSIVLVPEGGDDHGINRRGNPTDPVFHHDACCPECNPPFSLSGKRSAVRGKPGRKPGPQPRRTDT